MRRHARAARPLSPWREGGVERDRAVDVGDPVVRVDELRFVRCSAVVAMWIMLECRLGVRVEDVIAVTSAGGRVLS